MRVAFIVRDISLHEFLGIEILSAVLKQKGHQVKLIRASRRNWFKKLQNFSPQVVGFSIITGSHNFYIELCRQMKIKLAFFSIFGGPHSTFFPEMINKEGVDAVCIGEGELAILELLDRLSHGNSITDISNLWVKYNGKIFKNDVRSLISNMDDVPFPDRELIYEEDKLLMRNKMKYFLASRGCPYQCSYCFNESYYQIYHGKGERVRYRSVSNVLVEINMVQKKYPLELVRFIDDTFILDADWIDEFCCEYKKKIRLPFICNLRANLVTERVVKRLKEAGCKAVYMAIEAGNDAMRNEVLKRQISKEQIRDAFRILHENTIPVATENILGIPGETFNTAMETLYLNIEVKPNNAIATVFQPYPKTALSNLAVKKGLFDGDFDSVYESFFDRSALKFNTPMEKRKIENLQKFFGIAASFPWLLPAIKLAIRYPLSPLYKLFYRLWDTYCKRKHIFTLDFNMRDYLLIAIRTIRYR